MRLTTETFARRHTPMPLPMLPELKAKEEERRRGAVAFPSAHPGAPAPVAIVGATSGSPYVWFAKTLLRSVPASGLKSFLSAALVVGAGLGLGFGSAALYQEPEYTAASAAYIPHPTPVGAAAEPIRTTPQAPSSVTMVRGSDGTVQASPAVGASPAATEPAPAPAESEPAVEPAPAAAPEEALRDAVGSLKPRRAARGAERLSWGGQNMQAVQPQGGEFLPMNAPRAAGAAQALSGRRNGKTASLRRVANLKLGSSRVQPGSASRAMGQLKMASRLSSTSAQASGVEAAKQGGGDAFEQGKSVGGEGLNLDAVPSTGLSGSAPDVTEAPALPAGENKTPYQDKVDSAKKKNAMTKILLILGAILAAVGLALVLFAESLTTNQEWQVILKNIGYALIGAGAAMVLAGFLAAKQAKKNAKDVGEQYGQKEQAAVLEDCADQALNKQDCAPKAVQPPVNGVHEAVETESKEGYTLGDEGGPVAKP